MFPNSSPVSNPTAVAGKAADNANSLVLELEFAGRRLILPGDLEPPGLQPLFAAGKRNADVLLAPHHGSLRSEPATMWAWCSPEVVVISAGLRRAEPSSGADAYWAAGARNVFHTAVDGAVTIRMTSDAMHLRTGP